MGRVARYKKIKACDPFAPKNTAGGGRRRLGPGDADTVGVWGLGDNGRKAKKRSRTAQKLRTLRKRNPHGVTEFDVAPTEKEDDFDLTDLVGSLKREKAHDNESSQKPYIIVPKATATIDRTSTEPSAAVNTVSKLNVTAVGLDAEEEKEQAKLLQKVQQQVASKMAEPKFEDRRPGESKRAYNRRVQLETRQIIQKERQMEHNPLKRQRKKEFLNSKKKKQKRGRVALDENDSDGVDDDNYESVEGKLWTGEQAVAERAKATQVQFGEQAERPPVFHQLPRGAKKVSNNNTTSIANIKSAGTLVKEEDIEAERQAMDLMRRKVQAQYAAIKAKRKQAGDFHL